MKMTVEEDEQSASMDEYTVDMDAQAAAAVGSEFDFYDAMFAAALALSVASLGWAAWRLIVQYCCVPPKKTANDPSLPFQPPRRPTAVRSPSGQPSHYLKKSPSPNGSKPLPGSGAGALNGNGMLSPADAMPGPGPMTHHPQHAQYTEENELTNHNGNGPGTLAALANGNGVVDAPDSSADPEHPDHSSHSASETAPEYGRLGAIVFKLHYLTERSALVVSVVRCRGLPGKPEPQQQQAVAMMTSDGGTTTTVPTPATTATTAAATDPYVKLQLLPDKQHKVKTRVVRNTRNPVYDEDFTFYGLSVAELSQMSLHFVVLSFDRYSRDDVIGEVVCPLSGVDLSQIENQQVALMKEIQPRSLKIKAQGRGELLTSLCWQPAAAKLTVVLLKARNLPRMDVTGLADPYVKIYVMFNGQRIGKKKTHVKKRTLSPVFNESFAFDIPMVEGSVASLEGVSVELMLLDWDRVTKNEVIGRLQLGGARCVGTALNHWNEVCNAPRRQIAEWHKLNE